MSQNLNLFGCDHYPPWERLVQDGYLVCHKCGEVLRPILSSAPTKTLADAVQEHNRLYDIEPQ